MKLSCDGKVAPKVKFLNIVTNVAEGLWIMFYIIYMYNSHNLFIK